MVNINIDELGVSAFDKSDITYLNSILLNEDNSLKVVSYEELKDVPQQHISQFCVENGFYSIPTTELIEFLKDEIGELKAIEIAAGSGTICAALGIKGTDNFMQDVPQVRAYYETFRQTPVQYGAHVERLDGNAAVKKYRPDVVVAAWCTHKYDPTQPWRGGNQFGVDEKILFRKTNKKYIMIGNEKVHAQKPLLSLPHRVVKEPWIISRAFDSSKNVIYIWEH